MTGNAESSHLAARVLACLVGLLGLLVLASWGTSLWHFSALGQGKVPMAPSTALLLVLLSTGALLGQRPGQGRASLRLALILALTVLVYGLGLLACQGLGAAWPPESWLLPHGPWLGQIPLGRMSPLTAFYFSLAALALLCWLPPLGRQRGFYTLSALLALTTLGLALLVCLSYASSVPMLYGGRVVPMSLSTALLAGLLSGALLALSGPQSWFGDLLRPRSLAAAGSHPSRTMPKAALLILFQTLTIGAIGFFYLEHQLAQSSHKAQDEIMAISRLKVDQIVAWRQERLGDAKVILDNVFFQRAARQHLAGEASVADQQALRSWLASLVAHYRYARVTLYDAQGKARLEAPLAPEQPLTSRRPPPPEALRAQNIVEMFLHQVPSQGAPTPQVRYTIWIPIRDQELPGQPTVGLLLLQIDPYLFLYPLVNFWPTASQSAETVLLQRQDDQVVFLNEPRNRPDPPFSLRLPVTPESTLPASMAVLGRRGVVVGQDYRGVPVLAAIQAVPDTPWFLLAKVDQEEVFAPLRKEALHTGVIVLFMILVAGLGVGLFWRHRENQWLQGHLASQQRTQALSQRLLHLTQHANDIILLLDQAGIIQEANQRAVEAYGASLTELVGLDQRELFDQAAWEELAASPQPWFLSSGLVFESSHRRRDGARFPVEISSRAMDIDGVKHTLAIVRDISERRRAEQLLRKDEARMESLLRLSQYRAASQQAFLEHVLGEAVALTESGRGYLFRYQEDNQQFDTGIFWSANSPGDCRQASPPMANRLEEAGLWGEAVRQRRPLIVNDFAAANPLKRGYPAGHGQLRRFCTIPVMVEGRLVAVVGVADKESDYEDSDARQLTLLLDAAWKILERQHALLMLQESEGRFHTLVENAPDAIIIQTSKRFRYANKAAAALLGVDSGERLHGRPLAEFIPEQECDRLARRLEKAGGEAGVSLEEGSWRRGDGSMVDVEIAALPFRYQEQEGALIFARDITGRRRAEEALRSSEERYRLLFEGSADGIIILGAEGDEAGRILDVNQAVLDDHGFSREEFLAMSITDLDPNISSDELMERLRRLLSGEWLKFEAVHLRKDGSLLPLEVSISRVDFGGRRRLVSFERNISSRLQAEEEKRQLEKQFRQAQKMEALGTLAGGIAHDFNNLLTVIIGFAELSLNCPQEPEKFERDLNEIIQAATRARDLVRQILYFSRRREVESRPFDLNASVGEAANLLERTLPKSISIELRLAPALDQVLGDPNQMEQVLLNLATNAKDAMPQGGRLLMTTQNVELGDEFFRLHPHLSPGRYVLLEFSDNGGGMDEHTRERIFDPFFTTKELGKGTGLGLSTVYGIIKSHGGFISCYSQPGLGTTFRIYLAALRDRDEILEPGPAPPAKDLGGQERILLVDDEEPLRKMGELMLRQRGYQVLSAANGEEALAIYQEQAGRVDLVILDLGMPGMDGRECLRRLVALDPGAKVLITSGYAMNGADKNALPEGAAGFLAKPFLAADLLAKVRAVLEGI